MGSLVDWENTEKGNFMTCGAGSKKVFVCENVVEKPQVCVASQQQLATFPGAHFWPWLAVKCV